MLTIITVTLIQCVVSKPGSYLNEESAEKVVLSMALKVRQRVLGKETALRTKE